MYANKVPFQFPKMRNYDFLLLNQCYVIIIALISQVCLWMMWTVSQVSDVTQGYLFIHFSRLLIMSGKLIEVWLFVSVLGPVLPPENIGETDSSKDDPKSLSYAPRGNEMKSIIKIVQFLRKA